MAKRSKKWVLENPVKAAHLQLVIAENALAKAKAFLASCVVGENEGIRDYQMEASQQCLYIEWCVTDGYDVPYSEYATLMELGYTIEPGMPHGGLSGQELIKVSDVALSAFGNEALPPKPAKEAIRCTFSVSYAEGNVSMLTTGEIILHV